MRDRKDQRAAENQAEPKQDSGVSRRTVIFGAGALSILAFAGVDALTALPAAAGPWGGYLNGQIPTSVLTPIGGTLLRNDAAVAMGAMMQAHAAALGSALRLTEGYRDLAGQRAAYAQYGPDRAAYPGTSPHGWALAMDFGGSAYTQGTASWNWLRQNSQNYGWWWAGGSFRTIEPWHWEFDGRNTASPTPPPAVTIEEEEDMYIRNAATGVIAVFGADYRSGSSGPTGYHQFLNQEEYGNWRSLLLTYNSEIDRVGLDPRGKKFVPPANLFDVMGVDANGWNVAKSLYGLA